MMKRFLASLLCIAMLATLSMSALADEPKELVMWSRSFEDFYNETIRQIVEEYNAANRGYKVRVEFIAEAAWNERMAAAQAGGNAPDFYTISYNHIVTEAKNKAIQPLNGLVSDEKLADITTAVRSMVSVGDVYYAFPLWTEPSALLYYRKDLLADANLEVPTTWEQLIDVATKLNNNDRFGLAVMHGGDLGWASWGWQQGAAGHLAVNDNWDAATIDEGYRDLANFFVALYDSGAVPEQGLSGYGDITPFATDAVAMQINGSWAVSTLINDYPELEGKYGIAPCPTRDGNPDTCTATMGGWCLAIDGKAKSPEGAADFISFMMCEDASRWGSYYEKCNFCRSACTNSIAAFVNEKSADAGYEWAATINQVAANAIAEPVYPWDISVSVALMLENCYMHALDVDTALEQCINSINKVIADQNLAGTNPNK